MFIILSSFGVNVGFIYVPQHLAYIKVLSGKGYNEFEAVTIENFESKEI
jgi:hypothetical protein